jgi:asparagine synthase (glutamine-hydrolysing)
MVRVDLIRRFAGLGLSRQMLVVEAILTLAVAAAAIAFAPYRRAVKFGSRPLAANRGDDVEGIVWSVNAASTRVPWRAMCFERGLALQWMLRRRGYDAKLVYGARMKDQSGLDAHVWVTLNDRILIGGEEAETYGSLATHPECYGWAGRDLVFGSELKALRRHSKFGREIDRQALSRFVSLGYVPAPLSIYRGIFKLEPGCILTIPAGAEPLRGAPSEGAKGQIILSRYWSYRDVVLDGLARPFANEAEALDALDRSLGESIRGQAMADVPVGAFLSGGIDSSTVVALYQKYSSTPVRTFSIGFEEVGYDESAYAAGVAKHLGTVHHEHYVTVGEARDVIPRLPQIYDEPFADPSQIPTYLVSRFAREQVTVALTGDGGDELFAGYNRHFLVPRLWERLERVPSPLRKLAGAGTRLPNSMLSLLAAGGSRRPDRVAKLRQALAIAGSAGSIDDIYASLLDEWDGDESPVIGQQTGAAPLVLNGATPDAVRLMYADATGYLPDDILAKVDRASMAVSLETRVPYLDHRVAETAARIPIGMQVSGGQGKQLLRKLLYREAPRDLFERRKTGFDVPVGQWIKGPLRPWAEDLLDKKRMAAEGMIDAEIVGRRWQDHLSGRHDSANALWSVLMFQAWLREEAA